MSEAMMTREQALAALRRVHRDFLACCGDRFATRPLAANIVPGWIYLPVFDRVAWDGDLQ